MYDSTISSMPLPLTLVKNGGHQRQLEIIEPISSALTWF
jgi:hypothetical protein